MILRIAFMIFVATACVWPAAAQQPAADTAKPSAKDLFLNPRQMAYGAQDETAAPAKPKPKASVKPHARPKPAETAATESTHPTSAADASVQIVPASYSGVPLGLRYTLRKRDGAQTADVSSDTEFHTGDHIQVGVEVNDSGYLYIVDHGTSDTWRVLFPSAEIENGDNRVQRGHVYTVPPGYVFTFSGAPGTERLFVVFSRQPVQEIDSLIYSLKGRQSTPTSTSGSERPDGATLMASARPIGDSEIAKMRSIYSRDLIIEKGDTEAGSQSPDKSVYVVNPKGGPDSRVVADISLNYK
ncbi:MAG TPA: DUF4384 domain-containing protein [Bryobacteraceae bacterium]|nr:DUF4384 domain-containing protein [Bryobacteraceae bacterium]